MGLASTAMAGAPGSASTFGSDDERASVLGSGLRLSAGSAAYRYFRMPLKAS